MIRFFNVIPPTVIGCMIFSFVTMNIPFALLYIFLGGSFLYSAYSIWKKDKEDRG